MMTPSEIPPPTPSSASLSDVSLTTDEAQPADAQAAPSGPSGPSEGVLPAASFPHPSGSACNQPSAEDEEEEEEEAGSDPTSPADSSDTTTSNGVEPTPPVLKDEPLLDPVPRGFVRRRSSVSLEEGSDVKANEPVHIPVIPHGDPRVRSKLKFEVITARVSETAGKKHVSYTIMIKRLGNDAHPACIERRYSDFCYVYESILRNFHPSILGDFMFPKKVLIGNFKAEVITERTEAFHKFLNLISSCDNLLYSDYFYSFVSSEEHNEAVSHIKLSRYEEAIPLLENIFYVREKLLTLSSIHVLQCLCELVATLHAVKRHRETMAYAMVTAKSLELLRGHSEAEYMRVPFLKLVSETSGFLGLDKKSYDKQLAELRYQGVKIDSVMPLLELIRERYIHRASHTAKLS
eukprot:TCALIF_02161-PA protein Name:"Similar to SNX20 Sorting nexin-20 (Bos taurus)" AED:0.16 eAED:0.16 QI:1/0.5/0/0.66/1/0.66/3/0/405